uniref:mRNA cap guanine-N(7) methyltransferase n=1 Tax=Neogobius melanostomus TaxID=47308 RepID=A0A8C6U3G2_9GOBI
MARHLCSSGQKPRIKSYTTKFFKCCDEVSKILFAASIMEASTDRPESGQESRQESTPDASLLKGKHEEDKETSSKKSCDHSSEVAQHYNRLQEVGLEVRSQSRIFYMRNFNNWVKSVLIGEILDQLRKSKPGPVRVLDLGCGKGGDLLKWRRGNISHLVCTDIAEVSVEQCRSRYEDMKRKSHSSDLFTAEFITADAAKESLWPRLEDPALTFDLCSCQFVVHYSFETQAKAETMLRNACERIRPGGYFIGTTPDAYELAKRGSLSEDLSYGNEVFKVRFKSGPPFSLFGAEYHFSLEGVVDVPEFMVYFPLMCRMLEKLGMRLIMKSRFSEFFEEKLKDERHRSLLQKMGALEAFPAADGRQATTSDGEYGHVTTESRDRTLGTLSRSEWEAASIYLVYVFQKMEPASL